MLFRYTPIIGLIILSGCTTNHVAERTDRMVVEIARKQFDREPTDSAKSSSLPDASPKQANVPAVSKDVLTASYLEADPAKEAAFKFTLPKDVPGSEVPELKARTKEELLKMVKELYPALPSLPEEPKALPREDGRPYTLSELQEIAAIHSPTLKQAASDVRAAEGVLVQARTFQNPTMGVSSQASNNGETAGVWGLMFDQKINIGGKMALAIAAAKKNYDNAELALRKARSELATQVRTAYFGLLVAKETVRINRAVATLTDEIYLAQVNLLLKGGIAAGYEPASLRAQAYTARLALQQSITSYEFAWKQVVNTIGLRQLPLSEVAGRIDSHIPYFEYEAVLGRVLANHTDILTARNGIEISRYGLKLQRVTPFSDVDFQFYVGKETSLAPFQWQATGQVSVALPMWDRNRGNIMSAEAALIRAAEQPHAAELTLTNNLQNAYNLYKNNLVALDYYRRHILPDQVRAYRGVLDRRQLDVNAQFGDLVQAQQTLAGNVTSYLTILNQLWTSAIQVADFLQTDDLFELAKPQAIPALPDMGKLPPLPCCHPNSMPTTSPIPSAVGVPIGRQLPQPVPEQFTAPAVMPRIESKP